MGKKLDGYRDWDFLCWSNRRQFPTEVNALRERKREIEILMIIIKDLENLTFTYSFYMDKDYFSGPWVNKDYYQCLPMKKFQNIKKVEIS